MADLPAIADASGRWPAARAWAWYERSPWLMGCNFLPSTAVNFLAMWYGPGFDAATIAQELGWAAAAGFNTVRTNLAFAVWEHDRDGLMERLERFLDIAAGHGLATMFCLFDDCGFGGQEPVYGPQAAPVPGLHNSRAVASPGRAVVMDITRRGALETYVSDIIAHFAGDDRILAWDLYNEPGNRHVFETGSERLDDEALEASALTLMSEAFAWARRLQPAQPLTVAAWRLPAGGPPSSLVYRHPIDRAALALSDVISFHGYCRRDIMEAVIADLAGLGRPLLCTEWMARPLGSRIADLLALFAEKRIGAWQWGLVKGLSQTHIPWPALMEAGRDYDAEGTEWFHDLLRENGEPWSRQELEIMAAVTHTARARDR